MGLPEISLLHTLNAVFIPFVWQAPMNLTHFPALLFLGAISTLYAAETTPDERLFYTRDVMRKIAKAEKSADLFKNNPQFAHYREALALLEKSHCVGAYSARCDRFKQEVLLEPLLTETDLAGAVQNLSVLAVHATSVADEVASPEAAQAIKDVADPLKAAISAADPAQYAAIQEAYAKRRSQAKPEHWTLIRKSIHHTCEYILGIGNADDTEEVVAAAEARIAAKKK